MLLVVVVAVTVVVWQAQLVLMVPQAHREIQAPLVLKAQPDRKVIQAHKGLRALKATPAHKVQQELPVLA